MTAAFMAAAAGLALIQVLITAVWIAAYRANKTSIVDIYWGLLIFSAAVFYYVFFRPQPPVSLFFLFLPAFWSFRLAGHIFTRSRGHGEDPRYQELRNQWGSDEKKRMLIFFMQQGAAAWVFSFPFLIMFANPTGQFGLWQIAGIAIWLIAFNGESIADAQLLSFKRDPANKGRVCRNGLWRYSRHPNYFFEWLNWVAFAWLALPHSGGWLTLICPVIMFYFLNRVTGIPYAEKQALRSRPAEYAEYQRTTPAFFPGWPKK